MNRHVAFVWSLLSCLLATPVYAQSFTSHNYVQDGYAIEVPSAWQEKAIPLPAGGAVRAFMDMEKKRGAGYCQVEVQSLDMKRTPRLAALNEKQRREYHRQKWGMDEWMQFYPNLASAQNFRFVISYPSEIGAQIPASAMDFGYSVPGGYFYRVRAHLALTAKKGFSLWCIAIGHTETDADNNFRRYLMEFQTVAARFKPVIN